MKYGHNAAKELAEFLRERWVELCVSHRVIEMHVIVTV